MSSYPPPENNSPIYNPGTYTTDTSSLNIEDGDKRYLKLTGSISSGLQTFNGNISTEKIFSSGNEYSFPAAAGTIALESGIVRQTPNQTIQNKAIILSSNTSISSFTATTITTPRPHNLAVGDVIEFPVIGSMTGITALTDYTIATVPSSTTFTMSGITSMGGTVGTAYYYLNSRATANVSQSGGTLELRDASNLTNPILFDCSANAIPCIIQSQQGSGAARFLLPTFGGEFAVLANTQTFSGNKTFSGQLISTRAGNATVSNASLYINPSSTGMTGSNSYYWTYFVQPPSTGTSTGVSATVVIAGCTSTATNNYSLRIIAGATSYPSGSATVPSIVFNTGNNTSGFYSSASNVLNASISGTNILTINNTGISVAGNVSATTSLISPLIRPVSSTRTTIAPATDSASGTAQLRITPSNAGWSSGGLAYLELGDAFHGIYAQNAFGMEIFDSNAINLNSGNHVNVYDNGTTSYFCIGALNSDPIGNNSYGLAFGSGASGKSLSVFSSSSHTVKLGRNNDGDAIRFYRNNGASVVAVGSISLTTTNTTYNTTSDRRLKENLTPIDDALSIINQVQTYSYNFKNDDTKQTFRGVIADEIQQIMPEVVTGSPDSIDEYGGINPQMVDYSKIVPYLIRAVQQLSARN